MKEIVYVIDDDELARRSVCALVDSMGLASEAFASAEDFLECLDPLRPGCIVTDQRMLGMSGLELQEELVHRDISLPVVVITGYARTKVTVRAMQNGAVTLLEKPCDDHELFDAIRLAIQQDRDERARRARLEAVRERFEQLNELECQVLRLLLDGHANKNIAAELDVSVRTIEARRQQLFRKTGAQNVAELVRLAIEAGFAPGSDTSDS